MFLMKLLNLLTETYKKYYKTKYPKPYNGNGLPIQFESLHKKYNDPKSVKLYKTFHKKTYPNLYNVNGLPIHFDTSFKEIGISLSGGADSSLLFYILCDLVEQTGSNIKVHATTMSRFYDTKPWLEKSANDVYAWMKNRYPDIVGEHNWGFIPPDLELVKMDKLNLSHLDLQYDTDLMYCDVLCTIKYHDYLIKRKKWDYIYSGTTMNPPESFSKAPEFRTQEVLESQELQGVDIIINSYVINPFVLITKNWIMAQYDNFNLQDLLLLTRSCEADINVLGDIWANVENEQPPVCGHCFFCKERQWGIDNKEGYLINK
jgi:hypothetical protein